MKVSMSKYKVIDLFAGAGGLSLGFKQTKKFEIVAAVEKDASAKLTYLNNFPGVRIYDNILDVDFKRIKKEFGDIDVVIGGPPCQGFSNANRQHNQAINLNNKLVKEYIRAIMEIQPKAFVMENVGMLKSDVHRFYIEKNDESNVKRYNIPTKEDSIFLLEKKWKFKDVLKYLEDINTVEASLWPEELFKAMNIIYKNRNNRQKMLKALEKYHRTIQRNLINRESDENNHIDQVSESVFRLLESDKVLEKLDSLSNALEEPIALQIMLKRTQEIYKNGIREVFDDNRDVIAKVESCAVADYLTSILGAHNNGFSITDGILASVEFGIPQKRRRYIIIGVKKKFARDIEMPSPAKNKSLSVVYDALADLKNAEVYYSVEDDERNGGTLISSEDLLKVKKLKALRDSKGRVYNHIVPRTTETAMRRFKAIKPGENFHSLSTEMKEDTYTNADRTQNTVYLRLQYDEPSGTVINVRKSMWIHPELDRAVSVREAARLQSFPDSFRFYGTKDEEYQQVGNAVPPMLAKAIAKKILEYID